MENDRLPEAPLLGDCTEAEVTAFRDAATRRSLPAGHVFFRMGDPNTSLFIILSGAVRVERLGSAENTELTRLGSGRSFGEMSFLDGSRTSATVITVEPTEVLELPRPVFDALMREQTSLWGKFWRNLAIDLKQRLAETNRLIDHYADLEQLLRENPGFRDSYGRS